jgi:hypothetical protein
MRHAELNGETATVVMTGLNPPPDGAPSGGPVLFVKQDEAADFYRAGLCSALFSAKEARPLTLPAVNDDGKKILVITGKYSSPEAHASFERGLKNGGSGASGDFITGNSGYRGIGFSCIVLWGPSNDFLYSAAENTTPNIIFSWLDPEFTSPNVKVIIDDSPLQLLPAIVGSLAQNGAKNRLESGGDMEITIPSAFKTICLRTGSLPLSFMLIYTGLFARIDTGRRITPRN